MMNWMHHDGVPHIRDMVKLKDGEYALVVLCFPKLGMIQIQVINMGHLKTVKVDDVEKIWRTT